MTMTKVKVTIEIEKIKMNKTFESSIVLKELSGFYLNLLEQPFADLIMKTLNS